MRETTRGIVFQQVKYSETSVIAKIYTEKFGLLSFLIRGVRKKNAKIRSAHLQHLTLVEIETNIKSRKEIQHLSNLKIIDPFRDIPFNIKKSSILIFLNEILTKVIKEEEANHPLFLYLYSSIQFLDITERNFSLFHHLFLIQLSRYMGFFPEYRPDLNYPNFNLQEGQFTSVDGPGNLIVTPPLSDYLKELMNVSFENIDSIQISSEYRNDLLEVILNFYKYHIPGISNFKSHFILSEVLGN